MNGVYVQRLCCLELTSKLIYLRTEIAKSFLVKKQQFLGNNVNIHVKFLRSYLSFRFRVKGRKSIRLTTFK